MAAGSQGAAGVDSIRRTSPRHVLEHELAVLDLPRGNPRDAIEHGPHPQSGPPQVLGPAAGRPLCRGSAIERLARPGKRTQQTEVRDVEQDVAHIVEVLPPVLQKAPHTRAVGRIEEAVTFSNGVTGARRGRDKRQESHRMQRALQGRPTPRKGDVAGAEPKLPKRK